MKIQARSCTMLLSISTLVLATPLVATAQEQRLVGRLSDAVRPQVDGVLDSARNAGLPTEPIVDRALEGVEGHVRARNDVSVCHGTVA